MNEEQKQRMTHELGQWNAAMKSSCSVSDLLAISTRMAALLQDLIDAPEPEQPNQSEQHLEMVNAPALTDERIFKLFLEKAVDKGTAGIYDFARAVEREILGGGHD